MRVVAGPIIFVSREGADLVRSRETLGAGAMMLGSRAGAIRVCSERTLGAGGTTAALSRGADRDLSVEVEMLGAGAMTAPKVGAPRERLRSTLPGAGAITLTGRLGATRVECRPSEGGGPGLAGAGLVLKASRLATAPELAGSLRSGA